MNEFIENFQNFREWLFNLSVVTPDEAALLNRIKDKWEEFDLNSCFSDNDYENDSQQGRNKNQIEDDYKNSFITIIAIIAILIILIINCIIA